jgi:hypothetical protein
LLHAGIFLVICAGSIELNNFSFRNSWSAGGYKSQIFVRKSNSQLQAINIDLFSVGNNLYDALTQELEEDVQKYNLMFGAKEVYCHIIFLK